MEVGGRYLTHRTSDLQFPNVRCFRRFVSRTTSHVSIQEPEEGGKHAVNQRDNNDPGVC
jgi:hypothetical protein